MRADRRLCLDRSQSRLVEESDTAAAWLLAAKGQEIAPEAVKRLGLVEYEGRVRQGMPEPVVFDVPVTALEGEWVMQEPEPELEDAPVQIVPPESRRSRKKY